MTRRFSMVKMQRQLLLSTRRRRLQRIVRPAAQVAAQAAAALGVIALLSVVNLVAAPLRREKKPA